MTDRVSHQRKKEGKVGSVVYRNAKNSLMISWSNPMGDLIVTHECGICKYARNPK